MAHTPRLLAATMVVALAAVSGATVAVARPRAVDGAGRATTSTRPPAISTTRKVVTTPSANLFKRATSVSVKTMFPKPWRVASATGDKVEMGGRVVAEFAPFRYFGVKVPIEFTRIVPGQLIEYRYLPGGISTGLNRIEFRSMRDHVGAEHTEITHTSTYRITQPVLRALPFVYQLVHRAFVHGLIRRFGQAS